MVKALDRLIDSVAKSLRSLVGSETPEQRNAREALQLQQTVATLLFETARVDHDVRDEDLRVAEECLQALFTLSLEQAKQLLLHASHLKHRPTSYHPLVKIVNKHFNAEQKYRLVEHMWHVAHADDSVNMYEDHLVRKISELLYVPHREFIAAKHRARDQKR